MIVPAARRVRKLVPTLLALLALVAGAEARATDVNASVTISGEIAPGVYGRVDFGNRPPPPVVYTQPVIVVRQPAVVRAAPVYLHVPPGHAKKWSKHCHKYNACSQPVYFVKSAEYGDDRGRRGERGHQGRGRGRDD